MCCLYIYISLSVLARTRDTDFVGLIVMRFRVLQKLISFRIACIFSLVLASSKVSSAHVGVDNFSGPMTVPRLLRATTWKSCVMVARVEDCRKLRHLLHSLEEKYFE